MKRQLDSMEPCIFIAYDGAKDKKKIKKEFESAICSMAKEIEIKQ